ncbi:MAG: indolepyruvate ferredoxin oxidoreductase [Spartobacteria bacterium]|nr:indolepyruvate ferredoxin oxidoreductase [Spartobacteria bacterium]
MQNRLLLLGDEAIAQAALDAGISGAYAYPGTPSTEILEYIQRAPEAAERNIHREWSANEKTAMEEALGMSYAGRRALVSMKHVGLNVAADPFINSAITGANGGLVVVVADDPFMHSSQNEQDSRAYAKFAGIPVLEPADQQEAYDMVAHAFDLSEQMKLPVLFRITTRLAHSRADVVRVPPRAQNPIRIPEDDRQFVLLPANARMHYAELIEKQKELLEHAEQSPYNEFTPGTDRSIGIIATGLTRNYLEENYRDASCPYAVLTIRQYPVPPKLVAQLFDCCDEVLVVEEGYPFVEEMVRGLLPGPKPIHGRLDGWLPRTGELTPGDLACALQIERGKVRAVPGMVRPRPPQLCRGCPHIDSYNFLNEAVKDYDGYRVFSDIGCYTLGALPPHTAIHSCVDMGASVTMAKGAADAGIFPSLAVIGDSTFTHSGITGLLDAVHENSNVVILILDNGIVAMTGMQTSLATGRLEAICTGIGVAADHIRVVTPLKKHHEENIRILREEIEFNGVSVLISRRPCIHVKRKL